MSDLRTQRNVAVGVAAVVLALLIGFVLGRGSGEPREPMRPEVGAAAPAAAAPAATTAPATRAAEAPERSAARPVTKPAAKAPAPDPAPRAEQPAGERWTQGDPPPADPAPRLQPAVSLTVPDGTQLSMALTSPLSSQTAQAGDAVAAELTEAVVVGGRVAMPAGTRLSGHVTEAHALAKIGGQARLAFSFDSAFYGGHEVAIAAHFARAGKSETGKDAATIAAGAAIGIILGNQSNHNDRGKVIGGVLGGAAGTGVAAATKGETIELPAGTELRLTLRGAVTVAG